MLTKYSSLGAQHRLIRMRPRTMHLRRSSDKDKEDVQSPIPTPVIGEDQPGLKLSRDIIEQLKTRVFSFDTFYVTSVENYEQDGVVFKGNTRGKDVQASFEKLQSRLRDALGDRYRLFLLADAEDKPTAVVMPKDQGEASSLSRQKEVVVALAFALLTIISTGNANGVPLLQFLIDPRHTELRVADVSDALLAALAFWFILGSHEFGHFLSTQRWPGMKMSLPFFIPSGFGFLGSFGSITRLKGYAKNRDALLDFASSGPLIGSLTAATATIAGFILSASGLNDLTIDSSAFQDSFVMQVAADAFLGPALDTPEVPVNSLLVAGWAGLIVNSLNLIPAGELDGGRISLALWGRRTYSSLSLVTLLILGISSLGSSLSFYWIGLVLFLQRGPLMPCEEEISKPKDESAVTLGLGLLLLPLLILAPYPTALLTSLDQISSSSLVDSF